MQIAAPLLTRYFLTASAMHYRSNSVASVAQSRPMIRKRRLLDPLTVPDLEWLALRYVERYATTRGKLVSYLQRKGRERGWEGKNPPDLAALAQKMADLGYINDRLYAESKANAMARRGLGARRVAQALQIAGVDEVDRDSAYSNISENIVESALAFARKRRIGPFAKEIPDKVQREKQIASMIRAGHDFDTSRRIVHMLPQEGIESINFDD